MIKVSEKLKKRFGIMVFSFKIFIVIRWEAFFQVVFGSDVAAVSIMPFEKDKFALSCNIGL